MFSPSCVSDIDDTIFTLQYSDSIPPLSKAAYEGDLERIKRLVAKGYFPQTPDNRGWTAIHSCVASTQIEALKLILKLKPVAKQRLVNLCTWENVTPLHIALKLPKPSIEMIRVLLRAGANPKQFTFTKLSPLHLACLKKGNINIIKLLVQYGADVNVQEELSLFSPLHFAVCESQDLEVVQYLLHLTNLGLDNIYGRTAFLEACNLNFFEAVKLFLEQDKTLACCTSEIPALVYASLVGNLEMVELLIDSGSDPNYRCKAVLSCKSNDCDLILLDKRNFLPIHSAFTNIEVFKKLLELTDPVNLLLLETNYYSFALFVILYADEVFYEALLKSDLPNNLKTFNYKVLVQFILCYPDMEDILLDKFPLFFKYQFTLTPNDVFQEMIYQMPRTGFIEHYKILNFLGQMGLSNGSHPGEIRSTRDIFVRAVMTLKQYSRIAVRRQVRAAAGNDLLAVKVIKELMLPQTLKKFVLYECYIGKYEA